MALGIQPYVFEPESDPEQDTSPAWNYGRTKTDFTQFCHQHQRCARSSTCHATCTTCRAAGLVDSCVQRQGNHGGQAQPARECPGCLISPSPRIRVGLWSAGPGYSGCDNAWGWLGLVWVSWLLVLVPMWICLWLGCSPLSCPWGCAFAPGPLAWLGDMVIWFPACFWLVVHLASSWSKRHILWHDFTCVCTGDTHSATHTSFFACFAFFSAQTTHLAYIRM